MHFKSERAFLNSCELVKSLNICDRVRLYRMLLSNKALVIGAAPQPNSPQKTVFANQKFCSVMGKTSEEILAAGCWLLQGTPESPSINRMKAVFSLESKDSIQVQLRVFIKGKYMICDYAVRALCRQDGAAVFFTGVLLGVSEAKSQLSSEQLAINRPHASSHNNESQHELDTTRTAAEHPICESLGSNAQPEAHPCVIANLMNARRSRAKSHQKGKQRSWSCKPRKSVQAAQL